MAIPNRSMCERCTPRNHSAALKIMSTGVLILALASSVVILSRDTRASAQSMHTAVGLKPLQPNRVRTHGYTASTSFTFTSLPTPTNAVSRSQAVSTARLYAEALPQGTVPSGVTESVYYGDFSDELFDTLPVWLVVYSGAGVNIPIGGDGALFTSTGQEVRSPQAGSVAHEEAVAIDGTTGQFVMETMSSSMPALPAQSN